MIRIVEVGARDGLQNEKTIAPWVRSYKNRSLP
jgi:hypothetical protein